MRLASGLMAGLPAALKAERAPISHALSLVYLPTSLIVHLFVYRCMIQLSYHGKRITRVEGIR